MGVAQWHVEESYHTGGDLAATSVIWLAEPEKPVSGPGLPLAGPDAPEEEAATGRDSLSYYLEKLMEIGKEPEDVKKKFVLHCWQQMNRDERLVFNKLITGGFRIGISQKMIVNALAKTVGVSSSVIAHRISGNWDPSTHSFSALLSEEGAEKDISMPYPFYLAYALAHDVSALGSPDEWQAGWKWDGERGEVFQREDQILDMCRGE